MLGLSRRRNVSLASVVELPPQEAEAVHISELPDTAVLQQWMSFAGMQQKIIQALVSEIINTSQFVETETDGLSGRFQRLASSAGQQTARVQSLINLAGGVEVEGQPVSIEKIAELLKGTHNDVVGKISSLANDSMSMVHALDELNVNIGRVDSCMEQLKVVNRTTNILALNARIEAERAGTAGAAFRIVAEELRELSMATGALAQTMQAELQLITDNVNSGHKRLQQTATIDMLENTVAKDKLDVLLGALVQRSDSLKAIVTDAFQDAEAIAEDVVGIVTGIQFQDRMRQRLEHVVDTLHVMDEALTEIKGTTREKLPDLDSNAYPDMDWIQTLIDRIKMSEVRSRFVSQVIGGTTPGGAMDAGGQSHQVSSSGSVELF